VGEWQSGDGLRSTPGHAYFVASQFYFRRDDYATPLNDDFGTQRAQYVAHPEFAASPYFRLPSINLKCDGNFGARRSIDEVISEIDGIIFLYDTDTDVDSRTVASPTRTGRPAAIQ